jgi:hypothetical protein
VSSTSDEQGLAVGGFHLTQSARSSIATMLGEERRQVGREEADKEVSKIVPTKRVRYVDLE